MRLVRNILLFILGAAAILYIFDYAAARYRMGENQTYEDMTIDQYYAVKEKGNKIEYMAAQPFVERCIYSVFPHFGYDPCWWVARHTRREIEISGG